MTLCRRPYQAPKWRRLATTSVEIDGGVPMSIASMSSQMRLTRRTKVFLVTTRMCAWRGRIGLGGGGAAAEPQPPRATALRRTGRQRLTLGRIDPPAPALEPSQRVSDPGRGVAAARADLRRGPRRRG